MASLNNFFVASNKAISLLLSSSLLVSVSLVAQDKTDTVKRLMLASQMKKAAPKYSIRRSNVIFPGILQGNEEETLDYIEKFSSKRRDYLMRMHTKGKFLLPKAATVLKKYHLPQELKVLLTLESAYNGNAVSKAGAVGYWQIMDEVAREYGMKYTPRNTKAERINALKIKGKKAGKKIKAIPARKDERKNFDKATHTAARYLRDRRRNLDDNWLLIVASYNCGVGNVWNAMKKTGKSNPDFWDIKNYLPAETRAYVMNFITLNVIFNNYELFVKDKLSFTPEKIILQDEPENNMTESPPVYPDR